MVSSVVVSVLLGGCASGTGGSPPAPYGTGAAASVPAAFTVRGSLLYLQRVALPPDSVALVEVRETAPGAEGGPVVAERSIPLTGRQVPIPFELTVPAGALKAGRSYALRGGIRVGGRVAWVTDPVAVSASGGNVDLGELRLAPYTQVAFATSMRCGEQMLRFGIVDNKPSLVIDGQTFPLREVPSASGAKYEAEGDPSTSFWSKGDTARVSIRGRELPECTLAASGAAARTSDTPPFIARGNEPGWRVDIGGRIKLSADYGKTQVDDAAPAPVAIAGGRRYAVAGATPFVVTIFDRRCADNMSGMPYPNAVELALGGRTLQGCGGDPASLLTGAAWTVTALDGVAVQGAAKGTLQFGVDGRVAGQAFCNRFNAAYTLTGESLAFSRAASTMMACEPAVAALESKFNSVLSAVSGFEIGPDGQLVLKAPPGRSITARR